MKIWIDITNSPHVNFFSGMIAELHVKHEVVITSRYLANTVELLDLMGFPYQVIGRHYGQSKVKKIFGFILRVYQLYRYLKYYSLDVAISHSSFYSPVVGRLLRIPTIYLNDNEYAAGNRLSFIFANKIMVPEFMDLKKVKRQWARYDKIISYPGVKEGVYLWRYKPVIGAFKSYILDERKIIFVRPEPWMAQYYKGKHNFLDRLLIELKENFKIILLPRGEVQVRYYQDKKFSGITVLERSVSLSEIMATCDLFIGAGGTMTREAAVLGIPTISVYQDELLDVDKFLIEKEYMVYKTSPDVDFVIRYIENREKISIDKELLKKGRDAYELIKHTLLEIPEKYIWTK